LPYKHFARAFRTDLPLHHHRHPRCQLPRRHRLRPDRLENSDRDV